VQTFLQEVAAQLYREYGDEVSSLRVVLPSRRARLFFNEALASLAGRPLWSPRYLSVDELMTTLSGLHRSDPVRLICELYKAYSRHHDEPFDKFYFWGESLLADFDQVDKYLIDAPMLFVNIADLKRLESDHSYLTPRQIEIIREFWQDFNVEAADSPEKQRFSRIWNTLLPIYNEYRELLAANEMAYPGMVYRAAAERCGEDNTAFPLTPDEKYIFIGFNALSESEVKVFSALKSRDMARFFWDWDTYYVDNREQEAGLFLRDNLKRFPPSETAIPPTRFTEPKEIVAVAAPSDAMQCKYVADFLRQVEVDGKAAGKETAVVLTDENLLMPVLYAIPDEVAAVNITMGYPLRQTPAYTFLERLAELQRRKRERNGHTSFHHSDVTGLLTHPYIAGVESGAAPRLAAETLKRGQIFLKEEFFTDNETLGSIFRGVDGWDALCDYLTAVLASVGGRLRLEEQTENARQREFFALMIDRIGKLQNSLRACELDISDNILLSLLRKMLQNTRIPYEGEPLEGLQVMGILETRNLDFENVLILSVNEDTFPGNLSGSSSFIPYTLRYAYGLPTPQHHEGVYGYYFYRLLQRAHRIHLVYSVKADDKHTGEPSRYIHQLDYESSHTVTHRDLQLNVRFTPITPVVVEKSTDIRRRLDEFLNDEKPRLLTPSDLYAYVECPLKFYFQAMARMRPTEEITEEVDMPMFGTLFHKAAELIYGSLSGDTAPTPRIAAILKGKQVEEAVDAAVRTEFFKGDDSIAEEDFGGNLSLVRDIVAHYLRGMLAYDARCGGFVVAEVERWVGAPFEFFVNNQSRHVRLGGKVDRIDSLTGGAVRVVDYKTGVCHSEFPGLDALFSHRHGDRNPAVLQTLVYALALHAETGREVIPSLYYVRSMQGAAAENYSPLLVDTQPPDGEKQKKAVEAFSDYRLPLTEHLRATLGMLFDPAVPFTPCEDPTTCGYCPYHSICNR
jgi:hypothetical protein